MHWRAPLVFCLAISGVFGRPASGVEVPFAAIANLTTSMLGAEHVSAADIDGDGDLDLLSAASTDDEIVWWERFFGAYLKHAVNDKTGAPFDGATSVTAADVDGDGDLDLVASAGVDNDIAWFENDGTPASGFWTERTIDSAIPGAIHVAPADMDGDGDLDVVGAAFVANTVAWWENDGSPLDGGAEAGGEWTQHNIDTAFGGAFFVVPFDLDRDGDLDVVGAADTDDDIAWWENDGSGGGWTDRTLAPSFDGVRALVVADLDGDGDPDVIGSAWDQDQVGWIENDTGDPKTAAWTPRGGFGAGFDGAYGVSVTDLDLDGDPDIVAAGEAENEVAWWENDGTPANGGWTRRLVASLTGARGVWVGDLDGDGDPDVAGLSNSAGTLGWWRNDTIHRSALLLAEPDVAAGITGVPEIAEAADFDGDGDPDLLTNGSLGYRENDGNAGGWAQRTISTLDVTQAAAGDLDGDGDLDVVGSVGGEIRWWQNDGTPGDGAWSERLIDDDLPNQIVTAVRLGDIDGDGHLDVVASDLSLVSNGGVLAWWRNDGDPTDGGWTEHVIEDDSLTDPRDLVLVDLDRDGDLDVLSSAQNDNQVSWWQNDGDPTDGGAEPSGNWTEIEVSVSIGPNAVAAVDLGGNGKTDVLMTDSFGSIYYVPNSNGDGQTWGFTILLTGPGGLVAPGDIEISDLDLDGDLDVLFIQSSDGRVAWLEHPGTVSFGWNKVDLTTSFASVKALVVADFDGDGDSDLAAIGGTGGAGRVALWRNQGGQFALETTDTAPANLAAGADDDVLEIVAVHRGRAGDSTLELATLELLLETGDGVPLTSGEADALLSSIALYLDDGSMAYDGADTPIAPAATPPFALTAGHLSIAFADGDANVQVAQGSPATYFVVATAKPGAAGTFRITHVTEASSSAEDAAADIPLTLEGVANETSSGIVVGAGPTCYSLTLAGTGSGGTPAASPSSSFGCAAGTFAAGVPISLTATPNPGYVVLAWSGTDDDGSTAATNALTMPPSAAAVTATYGLAFDLLLTDETFDAIAVREACNSITAGDAVTVEAAGTLTLRAPTQIAFEDGVSVFGALTVDLATPSECP